MKKAPLPTKIAELYGHATSQPEGWKSIVRTQRCPFIEGKCRKNRKSDPGVTIGTCTMLYGRDSHPIMICPNRLLERRKIFGDCVHLLKQHEPGNELRIISELSVPGGSIDYCLVSVRDGKPKDFVGIELQTLDSTGTVWPERQRFIRHHGLTAKLRDAKSEKPFGMNWKMTAKTTLVQLNHKLATFEHVNRRLVLVMQDRLLDYMRNEFAFDHIRGQRDGDSMQFRAYQLISGTDGWSLQLKERISTDTAGIAASLGLEADSRLELQSMLDLIESRLKTSIALTVGGALPVPASIDIEIDEDS